MSRLRFPSLGKLDALADVTALLPGLTETELRRLLAIARGLRRERGAPDTRATEWAAAAAPCVDLARHCHEQIDALAVVTGLVETLLEDGHIADQHREEIQAGAVALDRVLDLSMATDGRALPHLAAALRAAGDPPT